jgi:hypothetical protein
MIIEYLSNSQGCEWSSSSPVLPNIGASILILWRFTLLWGGVMYCPSLVTFANRMSMFSRGIA